MAAHAAAAPDQNMAAQKPTLFIVRHGERVDETSHKAAWKAQTPANRRFEPPLTAQGATQARTAACLLYTSPSPRDS